MTSYAKGPGLNLLTILMPANRGQNDLSKNLKNEMALNSGPCLDLIVKMMKN